MKTGFTKFTSRFRMKVLSRTTNSWSLCRSFNSLFSCGFPYQYSGFAGQFFFFVFNHTHQQQQQQFKFFSAEQTQQSQFIHCSDTVRSLYTSQMNSYKAARPNPDHWIYLLSSFLFEISKLNFHSMSRDATFSYLLFFKTQAPCAHPGTSPLSAPTGA